MPHRLMAALSGALAFAVASAACAVGQRVDVQVVDHATGEVLTPILHDGTWWVAGHPGARYRVRLTSREPGTTLSVLSIDGVNAITGDTAGWRQSGYVLGPWQPTDVDGWRKNTDQIAAFTFAPLEDSYAARTGRPQNVGVIGVAVFDEKPAIPPSAAAGSPRGERRPGSPMARSAAPSQDFRDRAAFAASVMPSDTGSERLGTGHGEIEDSAIRWVPFTRAHETPDEIVTIHYDRLENLIAMGVVRRPLPPVTNPFPDGHRYVPDPPPRRP